jgi:hypothetical protein
MTTHFQIGKIYRINSEGPAWGVHTVGLEREDSVTQLPRGSEVVVIKEEKAKLVILSTDGILCWTEFSKHELYKWQLITE